MVRSDTARRFGQITGLDPIGPGWDAGEARAQFYRDLDSMIEQQRFASRLDGMHRREMLAHLARGGRILPLDTTPET